MDQSEHFDQNFGVEIRKRIPKLKAKPIITCSILEISARLSSAELRDGLEKQCWGQWRQQGSQVGKTGKRDVDSFTHLCPSNA